MCSRRTCSRDSSRAVKDLRIIQNRSLDSILIVDNSVGSFGPQIANGIPILPFNGSQDDKELLHLKDYLLKLVVGGGGIVEKNSAVFSLDKLRTCKESSQYLDVLKSSADARSFLMRPPLGVGQMQPPSDSESC